jgi:hypothetical protein
MDMGFLIMIAPFAMVVGIVWVRSQAQIEEKRIAAAAQSRAGQPPAQDNSRVEELEERVRVLERIVTDGGYDLAHRIEALRDERPPSAALGTRAETERVG